MFDTLLDETLDPSPGATSRPATDPPLMPSDLDSWQPSVFLAAVVSNVDVETLSPPDRVRLLRATRRLVSHLQAAEYRAMASVADAYREHLDDVDEELAWDATAAEIAAALSLTRRAASRELGLAETLRARLPRVWDALAAGDIDRQRAWVISQEVMHLPEDTARTVVDQIIEHASGSTTGQLAHRIRRLAIAVDPAEASERYEQALDERRVVTEATVDGTAHLLVVDGPPDRVQAASDRIDRIARSLSRRGDDRTMDQRRADVALDLLCEGEIALTRSAGGRGGGRNELRVDLETLAGLSEQPGELSGYGPIVAELARQVALEAQSWDYVVTDSADGQVVAAGALRRRPTADQARRVRFRTPRCAFPGCRMPAIDCDLDHRRPRAKGGPTTEANLAPLCRHHHHIRHVAGWTYDPDPGGGHTWTSPLGLVYTSEDRAP